MNADDVEMRVEPDQLEPGDTIRVWYRIHGQAEEIAAVERSIRWRTEGKGDEDDGAEFRERLAPDDDGALEGAFETVMPASPLSYDGAVVSIRWFAAVRVIPQSGQPFERRAPFHLGHVAPADV